jgi:hypothetical protein
MQKLQLYINNQRVDLFKDEQVSFNQSIQNIKDPAKIFTEFSQTFTIPASKINNQIFQHYYNYDIVDGFDARNKVDALIELNNITFQRGYVKLTGTELKNNRIYSYKITFFGKTVNLKDVLGDDKLGVLDDLDQYKLDYSAGLIKSRLQSPSGAILCPLITSGASGVESRLFYNSDNSKHLDDTGNLYYHTGSSHDHGVLWSDLKYAIRVYEIIEAIENQPNYDITFTRDFFSTTNTEFYNLYLWLHRKKGSVEPAVQVTTYPTLIDAFPLSGLNNRTTNVTGSAIIINEGLLPTIQQDLTLTTGSSTPYDVTINRNNTLFAQFTGNVGTKTFNKSQIGTMDAAVYTVIVSISDPLGLTFSSIKWEFSGYDGQTWTDTYDTSTFQLYATFEFIITEQIPDIKIIDFLTGLFKMFNLTAYYVSNAQDADYGKIRVEKLDNFYATGTSYDISEYVDTQTGQVNVALPYKEIEFGYEGTGTFLALQYEQLQNKSWGAEQFKGNSTVGNNFDAPNPVYKITLPFEHMQFERLVDANASGIGTTDVQWGYFVDDNQEAYIGKPLLFYPIQITSGTEISFRTDSTNHSPITNYIIPSNSLSLSSSTSTKNINFYLEINEYTLDTTFTGTLFEENYLRYIQNIFNGKRRLTNIKADLPLNIIKNLKMNDKVTINNQDYIINTLQTNLITGKSNLEIINELESDSFAISMYYNATGTSCSSDSGRTLVTVYSDTSSIVFGTQNVIQTIGKIYANKELTVFADSGNYSNVGGSKYDRWNKIAYTPTAPSLLLEGWWQSEFENATGEYPKGCGS